jgi:DUF1680 family protein
MHSVLPFWVVFLCAVSLVWADQEESLKVKKQFIPVSFTDVRIEDVFWKPRQETNRTRTIPYEYEQCKKTGRIDGFRPDWQPAEGQHRHIFYDSDVAKWIEAASYSLALHPDPELDKLLDEVIEGIASCQLPDGYLNSYFVNVAPDKRWTNLRDCHELYCAGHLIEAAVAHYQATGKRRFLDIMCRYADHIDQTFGTAEGKKRGYCGHEEIELALVKLYHATGEKKYLELSKYFVDERGRQPHYFDIEARARGEDPNEWYGKTYEYCQADKPLREQRQVTGHAVRAMYIYSAMADLAGEYGDATLMPALNSIWDDVTLRRMYITGGLGPSGHNEGFTTAYDLPNETAYAETCAAIGFIFWSHRMLQLDCDSKYADAMERALYNGALSGISIDGTKFFYTNPLASSGQHERKDWFGCACCPPNICRLLASVGQYIYSCNESDVAVHLYVQGSAKVEINGQDVILRQKTDYPWDGRVTVSFEMNKPTKFGLRLRIPGWCRQWKLRINGEPVKAVPAKGYVRLERQWTNEDIVELYMAMPVERVYAHPNVQANVGRVALQRGPIVYCLEQVDNPGIPLNSIILPRDTKFETSFCKDLLGGVVVLKGKAKYEAEKEWDGLLYRIGPPKLKNCEITAIPYYAWCNRGKGSMIVWIRE